MEGSRKVVGPWLELADAALWFACLCSRVVFSIGPIMLKLFLNRQFGEIKINV